MMVLKELLGYGTVKMYEYVSGHVFDDFDFLCVPLSNPKITVIINTYSERKYKIVCPCVQVCQKLAGLIYDMHTVIVQVSN